MIKKLPILRRELAWNESVNGALECLVGTCVTNNEKRIYLSIDIDCRKNRKMLGTWFSVPLEYNERCFLYSPRTFE